MSKQVHVLLRDMQELCPVPVDVTVRADRLRPQELRARWIFDVDSKPFQVELQIPDSSSNADLQAMLEEAEALILEALA